ncbi:proline iminopeptidase [Klebsiella michiganensis]|nr:proline iminopeptidase [Klebsiella michiganensis]
MYTIREGYAPFRHYQTWFRVCGDIDSGLTPLVVAHGGPGCTHDYVDAFRDIALSGRAVIHYDQLGNGRSTHLPQQPADFWQPALFLDELANLLLHLNIADNYALLGQSWGGMLGAEHAVTQPKGLKALIIANSPASMALWLQGAAKLRAQLPADVQQTLLDHEAAGTLDSAEYKAASRSILSTPRLSARSLAGGSAAHLRCHGCRPDGLSRHEWPHRIPRYRQHESMDDYRPPRAHYGSGSADFRALR